MVVGFCEYCGKLLDDGKPAPEDKLLKNTYSLDELYEIFSRSSHYICADCVKKYVKKEYLNDKSIREIVNR